VEVPSSPLNIIYLLRRLHSPAWAPLSLSSESAHKEYVRS
jgi:hypothetical protein